MSSHAVYRHIALKLQNRKSLPSLAPDRPWHPGLDEEIAGLAETELAGPHADGLASARAWKAALHLWNDSLERAHELVQELDTPTGSALHGIMHRREGDFSNAKYWFRRAGDHPACHGLQARVTEWLSGLSGQSGSGGIPLGQAGDAIRTIARQGIWNPYLFTDAVEIATSRIGEEEAVAILEGIQHLELAAFLRYLEARLA